MGELQLAVGDLVRARHELQGAVTVARHSGLRPELGRTQLALAQLLLAEGAPDSTVLRQLNSAADLLDGLGLGATVDRALRDPGLRRLAPRRRVGRGALDQRTLLITDMVSSTHVNASLGDAHWLELIDMHDRLIRGVLAAHSGHEFSHTGDGIAAWFADPGSAAATARDLQERFAQRRAERPSEGIRIRIGIGTGRPLDHDRRVLGVDVARTTRITAAASADEVFLDEVTVAKIDKLLFPTLLATETELRGLPGRHRLFRLLVPSQGIKPTS